MRISEGKNTRLLLSHGNEQILIIGKSGHGKTLATESIVEKLHKKGYVIISLTDVKDQFELAYAMFKPRAKYHLGLLKKYGKEPSEKKVKLYHPFTFNLPRKQLPDINVFTLPIKDLTRNELSMLVETREDTDSLRMLLNGIKQLGYHDGLWEYMFKIRESMKSEARMVGRYKMHDLKPGFWLDTGIRGSRMNMQEIQSHFMPFIDDMFLMPEKFEFNLDFKKIYQDQEHYHIFTYKWIKDPKMKYFTILFLFNKLIEHRDECKHPVCFIFEEVRNLVPYRSEGYKSFLAEALRDRLSVLRNIGKGGCTSIMNSQVFSDIDLKVRDSATETFFGNLGSLHDIAKITRSLPYDNDLKYKLNSLGKLKFIRKGYEDYGSWNLFVPSHMHAEEQYDFFEEYRHAFKDRLRSYEDLIEQMKDYRLASENKIKTIMEAKIEKIETIERNRLEKEASVKLEQEEKERQKADLRLKEQQDSEQLKNVILEEHRQGNISIRKLAIKHGLPYPTIRYWVEKAKKENI